MYATIAGGAPEKKFVELGTQIGVRDENRIVGYASLFGQPDQSGDVVSPGAYAASLDRLKATGRNVKMLWQHDPARPIGVWDRVIEDKKGLYVSGRILREVQVGAEAVALLAAGAIDGLSIGYRTVSAQKSGQGRVLTEIDLWEVSLVTFPMLSDARVQNASPDADEEEALARALADTFAAAGSMLTRE